MPSTSPAPSSSPTAGASPPCSPPTASAGELTAVDDQLGAGHGRRRVGREKDDGPRDRRRLGDTPEGEALGHRGDCIVVLGREKRRPHQAGADGVHSYSLASMGGG